MQAWEHFLEQQEKELGSETVDKWLRSLEVLRFDACNLYLEAKDSFQAMWFEEHVRHKVQTQLLNNNSKRIKTHLSVKSQKPAKSTKTRASSSETNNYLPLFTISFEELDPFCTFDHFVKSEHNILAYKLLQEICNQAKSPEATPTFNPIFIHGHHGAGKSHLLIATAHELKRLRLKVMYSQAETFTEHVVKAIRAGEMQTFRKAYRNVDVLLIDDVHALSRKSATQEEFFHTFNTLHLEGKQIILSSSYAPQELKYIEPRLVSRFEWGIVLPLTVLPKDHLKSVLEYKAESLHFQVSEELSEFLLETFYRNPKSLVRAIEALSLRTHMDEKSGQLQDLPLSRAKDYLSDLIAEESHAAVTPEKILQAVAEFYGIRVHDILSKSHAREYTLPRQIAMYLCRSMLEQPYMKIGEVFSRDHSTVMTSIKQVSKHLEENNKELLGSVNSILNKFQMARH